MEDKEKEISIESLFGFSLKRQVSFFAERFVSNLSFVWASGNGGAIDDSCAADGYSNLIETITVSGSFPN